MQQQVLCCLNIIIQLLELDLTILKLKGPVNYIYHFQKVTLYNLLNAILLSIYFYNFNIRKTHIVFDAINHKHINDENEFCVLRVHTSIYLVLKIVIATRKI